MDLPINQIVQGNCFEVMKEFPDNSVDLVVTSPPYNLNIHYSGVGDDMLYEDYLDFAGLWLQQSLFILKHDGRLCLNIPFQVKCGKERQSIYVDVVTIAKKIGFKYQTTIVWNKQAINRITAWGSWLSASAPFIATQAEVIVVLYKENWVKKSGSKISDIKRDEFIKWVNGVWEISNMKNDKRKHPGTFPIELPKRCIKLFSFVEDIILDPFIGSGTTALAAINLNRKYVGIDISEEYCNLARRRIDSNIEEVNK